MPGRELVKLYYRIGEVSKIVGVQPHVLRYWETEFRTIRPQKSGKGQRVYSRRDVGKLLEVKDLLRNQGFTIAGARKRLVAKPSSVNDSQPPRPIALRPELKTPSGSETGRSEAKPEVSVSGAVLPGGTGENTGLAPSPLSETQLTYATPCHAGTQYAYCVPVPVSVQGSTARLISNSSAQPSDKESFESSKLADRSARTMRRVLLGLRQEMFELLDEFAPAQQAVSVEAAGQVAEPGQVEELSGEQEHMPSPSHGAAGSIAAIDIAAFE